MPQCSDRYADRRLSPLTSAELKSWIKRRRLSHSEAADLLALSRDGLRKNLYDVTPIGAQTARIVELLDAAEPTPPAPRYSPA
jgi:hypothetical protein